MILWSRFLQQGICCDVPVTTLHYIQVQLGAAAEGIQTCVSQGATDCDLTMGLMHADFYLASHDGPYRLSSVGSNLQYTGMLSIANQTMPVQSTV